MSDKPDGGEEEQGSLGGTIAGALAIVAIIALGIWLVGGLSDSNRYAQCAAARHRNCDNIDFRKEPAPQ